MFGPPLPASPAGTRTSAPSPLSPLSPAAGGLGGRLAGGWGRRTPIGLTPPPGACSARPAWWSRADWTGVEVWCVVAAGVDVCRAVHADPHTVVRVARAMAGYADYTTGRDCRPTNSRLATVSGEAMAHRPCHRRGPVRASRASPDRRSGDNGGACAHDGAVGGTRMEGR